MNAFEMDIDIFDIPVNASSFLGAISFPSLPLSGTVLCSESVVEVSDFRVSCQACFLWHSA